MQRLRDQGETADGYSNNEFGRSHPGTGKYRNRGDAGFNGEVGVAHRRGFNSPSRNIKARIG
jgi:hypothetical protein